MRVGVNAEAGYVQQVVLRISGYFVHIDGCALSQFHVVFSADNPKRCVQPPYPAHSVNDKDAGMVAIADGVAHMRSVYVPAIRFVL